MNKCRIVLCVMLTAASLQEQNVMAETGTIGGVDLNSSYIYHGVVYNDGLVLQPWLDATKGSVTYGVWANFDIQDYNGTLDENEFSEVDLYLSYDVKDMLGIAWTFRYAEYLFPHLANLEGTGAFPGTRELILKAKRALIAGLTAELCFQYDIDEYEDLYARLKLTYDLALSDAVGLTFMGSGAYAGEGVSAGGESGLNEYDLRVSSNYYATEKTSLGANVGYTDALDEDVLPDQPENWYGGVSIVSVF